MPEEVAISTLKLSMSSMSGNKTVNVKYINAEEMTLAKAQAFAGVLVTNTSIFADQYTGLRSASVVTTTTVELI